MTVQEAINGVKRLQASYPTMAKLDEASITAYVQEIGTLRRDDFVVGMTEVVRNSKFFPSISEILDAAESARRKRLEAKEHADREARLALKAGQDAIMDPKADVHRVVVGPNHQKCLDMLSGKITLPEPEWMKGRKTPRAPMSQEGRVPISQAASPMLR